MKPIFFITEMVRAILDGRKTVTRRVVKQNTDAILHSPARAEHPELSDAHFINKLCLPPYQPGDVLYVRETWNCLPIPEPLRGTSKTYWYLADDVDPNPDNRWRPSIHMPKEAARLFLRVTDVRAERLQDISPFDAHDEGIAFRPFSSDYPCFKEWLITDYRELWDRTIQKQNLDRYGWEANPWVWVIKFERCEKP